MGAEKLPPGRMARKQGEHLQDVVEKLADQEAADGGSKKI